MNSDNLLNALGVVCMQMHMFVHVQASVYVAVCAHERGWLRAALGLSICFPVLEKCLSLSWRSSFGLWQLTHDPGSAHSFFCSTWTNVVVPIFACAPFVLFLEWGPGTYSFWWTWFWWATKWTNPSTKKIQSRTRNNNLLLSVLLADGSLGLFKTDLIWTKWWWSDELFTLHRWKL